MPYTSKFKGYLEKGRIYEVKATEYFDYKKVEFPEGKFSEYDFILDDKIKIEVKSDTTASRTGNLAIEYKCNGKPSGIYATEADYYIYFINYEDRDEAYKIPTNELIELCKERGRKVSGGDGNLSRMYLLNKELLKDYIVTEKLHEPIKVEFKKNYKMPFGIYKGEEIEDLWKTDKGKKYLLFLDSKEWFDKFEDLKEKICSLKTI